MRKVGPAGRKVVFVRAGYSASDIFSIHRFSAAATSWMILVVLWQVAYLNYLAVAQRDFIRKVDFTNEIKPPSSPTYTATFLQVTGGSLKIALHGIYSREFSLEMPTAKYEGRPVYRQLTTTSPPNPNSPALFIFWTKRPEPMWVISSTPQDNPELPFGGAIAKFYSRSFSPGYTKGWHVLTGEVPAGKVPYEQLPESALNKKLPSLADAAGTVLPSLSGGLGGDGRGGDGRGGGSSFIEEHVEDHGLLWTYDPDLIIDEARPGTYSLKLNGSTEAGCPNSRSAMRFGFFGYKLDPCTPPIDENVKGTHHLDFKLHGADKRLVNALFSWDGYFLRRPFFALRSAVNPAPTHGVSEFDGRILYLWAEGFEGTSPIWRIGRDVGNIHESQIFAQWQTTPRSKVPADWPAESTLELNPSKWLVAKRPGEMYKSTIWTSGVDPTFANVNVRESLTELNGPYHYMANYMGYPFFRQAFTPPGKGFVMYRGRVVAADLDTWVIGSRLGSKQGLKAWVHAPTARWPHLAQDNWQVWNPTSQQWITAVRMTVDMSLTSPAVQMSSLLGRCPMPSCHSNEQIARCPPVGSCDDCVCKSISSAVDEPVQASNDTLLAPALSASEVLRRLGEGPGDYDAGKRMHLPQTRSWRSTMTLILNLLGICLLIVLAAILMFFLVALLCRKPPEAGNVSFAAFEPPAPSRRNDMSEAASQIRGRYRH